MHFPTFPTSKSSFCSRGWLRFRMMNQGWNSSRVSRIGIFLAITIPGSGWSEGQCLTYVNKWQNKNKIFCHWVSIQVASCLGVGRHVHILLVADALSGLDGPVQVPVMLPQSLWVPMYASPVCLEAVILWCALFPLAHRLFCKALWALREKISWSSLLGLSVSRPLSPYILSAWWTLCMLRVFPSASGHSWSADGQARPSMAITECH